MLSIVQLSRFFLCSVSSDSFYILSKALSFVKNFFIFLLIAQATALIDYHIAVILSTTFLLSDLPPPRLQISFSVVSRYPIVYSSHSLAVPPPRLQKSVPVFRIAVISDKWYPIMYGSNCQCFSCFLFISDNSNNYPFYRFFSVIAAALKTSESPEVPTGIFWNYKQLPSSRTSPEGFVL